MCVEDESSTSDTGTSLSGASLTTSIGPPVTGTLGEDSEVSGESTPPADASTLGHSSDPEGTDSTTHADDTSTSDATSSSTDPDEESGTSTSAAASETEASSTASTGDHDRCGDGLLDPDEECDGTPGCEPDCTLTHYDCNPIHNVPCAVGQKCSLLGTDETTRTQCIPFTNEEPGQLHEGECFFDSAAHDEWCDVGLACGLIQTSEACYELGTTCCVEFCDVRDPSFRCAHPGEVCVRMVSYDAPPGLEHLGWCVRD